MTWNDVVIVSEYSLEFKFIWLHVKEHLLIAVYLLIHLANLFEGFFHLGWFDLQLFKKLRISLVRYMYLASQLLCVVFQLLYLVSGSSLGSHLIDSLSHKRIKNLRPKIDEDRSLILLYFSNLIAIYSSTCYQQLFLEALDLKLLNQFYTLFFQIHLLVN